MKLWDGKNTADFEVMTREQVRSLDAWAINQMEIPGAVLMENAGRSCAECLMQHAQNASKVLILCGGGNNGGDGYVIARHLYGSGFSPTVLLTVPPEKIKGDALVNLQIIRNMNIPVITAHAEARRRFQQISDLSGQSEWIVDAFLGTGMKGLLSEEAAEIICAVNKAEKPALAVDIPSGMDCDTGFPLPVCIQAAVTVTFAAIKKGFVENPQSAEATGKIYVASIGIPANLRK